jgi:tetratricopeptide (TPR) repeat protein
MTHLHHGTPPVQPDFSSDWRRSKHYTILRQTSIKLFEQWRVLFIDVVGLGPSKEERAPGEADWEGEEIPREGIVAESGSDSFGDDDDCMVVSADYALRWESRNYYAIQSLRESKISIEGSINHGDDDAHEEDKDHENRVAQLLCDAAITLGGHPTLAGLFKAHCLEVAARLRSDDAEIWHELGGSWWEVAKRSGSAEASGRAVEAHQNALQLVDPPRAHGLPPAHDRGHFFSSLATALHTRFELIGKTGDLDKSIDLHQKGLAMCSRGHPDRALSLNNMVGALNTYLEMGRPFRQAVDVDNLMSLQRECLELLPQDDKHRGLHLSNLAFCLRSRGESTSSIDDLDEVIRLGREALVVCPPGDADRGSALNRLAWDLLWQYEVQGDSQHLEEAVQLGRESLSLCPVGRLNRYRALDTLATALHFNSDCLDEALQLSQESLSLIPPSHVNRWKILMTLANIHLQRFKGLGSADELEEAISVCEEALAMQPPEHFRRHKLLTLQDKLAEAKSSSSSAV